LVVRMASVLVVRMASVLVVRMASVLVVRMARRRASRRIGVCTPSPVLLRV